MAMHIIRIPHSRNILRAPIFEDFFVNLENFHLKQNLFNLEIFWLTVELLQLLKEQTNLDACLNQQNLKISTMKPEFFFKYFTCI